VKNRIPTAVVVVGSVFAVAGMGCACGALYILRHQTGPSDWLLVLLAFGWTLLAMTAAIALSLPRAALSGRTGRRVGLVTVQTGLQQPGELPAQITGPGIEVEGSADLTVRSRLPSLSLWVCAFGLAAVAVCLYAIGKATLKGCVIGVVMAYFIANWARQARVPTNRKT